MSVVEFDAEALAEADRLVTQAITAYAECTATGRWPGYPPGIHLASLPPWQQGNSGPLTKTPRRTDRRTGRNRIVTTTAVATKKPPTLAGLIEQMKPEIARVLPAQLNPDRMARIATTCVRQTPPWHAPPRVVPRGSAHRQPARPGAGRAAAGLLPRAVRLCLHVHPVVVRSG